MKQKKYFNMIELALAIAVIAVGISSIMVLFPVGINATQDAVANNNITDVAEQIVAQIKAYGMKSPSTDWRTAANGGPATDFVGKMPTAAPTPPELADFSAALTDQPTISKSTASDYSFRALQVSTLTDGGSTVPRIDFDAGVRVWRSGANDFSGLPNSDPPPKAGLAVELKNTAGVKLNTLTPLPKLSESDRYYAIINIEISWPLELPYATRVAKGNVRLYRIELFNPNAVL